MFIPHKTFSVIRDHLVHHNCKEKWGACEVQKNWKYLFTLDRLRIRLKTKQLFSVLPLHFGNLLYSVKTGNEWRKKQLQSRWNEERGTLLGNTKEMQIKQEETLFNDKVQRKTFSMFQKGLLLFIHPNWVHESHSILFSSLHLYLQ